MSYHGFTLRLPESVYAEVTRRKRKSLTAYVVEAVVEKLARDREAEIRMGLQSLVGSVDPEEFALWETAQREAMKKIDD